MSDEPKRSRRSVLATLGATTVALAGCTSTGSESPNTTSTTKPRETTTRSTQTTTEQHTTTDAEERSFTELYLETANEPWEMEGGMELTRALNNNEIRTYDDPDDFDSFADVMIGVKDEILGAFSVVNVAREQDRNNDIQELTTHLRHAVHNDLDYSPDEVRVLGRDTAGGGTYTAILHRNDDGDWVKDLTVPFSGEGAYLAHDDTKADIHFNDEASRGLWNIWHRERTPIPGTDFSGLKWNYENAEFSWDDQRLVDKANDHVVVGDRYGYPNVGYTVEAARTVEDHMSWHDNETFNQEMAVVERATEAYHNSEKPDVRLEVQDGTVTAVPTAEHTPPENLYG